jgi:hypothetical protein
MLLPHFSMEGDRSGRLFSKSPLNPYM